jgi:hypothetical protein
LLTASAMGSTSSDAPGATTTPPTITPVAWRAKSLTKPSCRSPILARALVASGSCTTSTSGFSGSAFSCMPTVAISGWVKTLAATVLSRIGVTASPSACHMAMRPCMAATDASWKTPVTSPAA